MSLPSLRTSLRRLSLTFAVVAGLAAAPAHAQFRNMGVQLPNVGYMGLGSLWDPVLQGVTGTGPHWNVYDQPTLGAGYFLALGYNLWLDNTVAIGASGIRLSTAAEDPTAPTPFEPIFTLLVSTGLRYNFLEERFRPFLGAHINYLQVISVTANPNIPVNALLGNSPFWVGGRFSGGAEYFFAEEMSVMGEIGLTGLVGLNESPCIGTRDDKTGVCDAVPGASPPGTSFVLPATVIRVAYLIYF